MVTISYTFLSILIRNLIMYADAPLRRPTFDASRAVAPFTAFFVRIVNAFIQARRIEAARQTALHLKATNRDFANIGYHDLVQRLLDDRDPNYLDGSQVSKWLDYFSESLWWLWRPRFSRHKQSIAQLGTRQFIERQAWFLTPKSLLSRSRTNRSDCKVEIWMLSNHESWLLIAQKLIKRIVLKEIEEGLVNTNSLLTNLSTEILDSLLNRDRNWWNLITILSTIWQCCHKQS